MPHPHLKNVYILISPELVNILYGKGELRLLISYLKIRRLS